MCPLALQHSAGLWSRLPSDTSLPCSATTEGIEWASAAAPPAGHAAEASGTARSSHTTEGSKDRAGEGKIKGWLDTRGNGGGQRQEVTSETKTGLTGRLRVGEMATFLPPRAFTAIFHTSCALCYIWLCVVWGHSMFLTALTHTLSNPHQRLVFCTLTYIPKSSLSFRLSR